MGKKVTNHISTNKQKLQDLTNANKIKAELNIDSENKVFKLKQFNNVKSKLDNNNKK